MTNEAAQKIAVFERAAELFGLLSTPIRLRIISQLCNCEKNVGQLLESIEVAQPNMSQHLNMLYRAGVVAKRRCGAQVFYRIADESAVLLCRAVCTQVAIGMDERACGRVCDDPQVRVGTSVQASNRLKERV